MFTSLKTDSSQQLHVSTTYTLSVHHSVQTCAQLGYHNIINLWFNYVWFMNLFKVRTDSI